MLPGDRVNRSSQAGAQESPRINKRKHWVQLGFLKTGDGYLGENLRPTSIVNLFANRGRLD